MANKEALNHLKESNYWTWFTNWLLAFGGKAAWPVLIITTLYMGAELYPGVNLPAGLNFSVFLAQLFALDMGGMGLVNMARQAEKNGNADGAKDAEGLGRFLVGIVIVSLITAGTKQFLAGIPALTTSHTKGMDDSVMTTYVNPAIMIVEFILVIARVICAVLYGKVMHALTPEKQTPPPPTPTTPDIEELVREAIDALRSNLDTTLTGIINEQQQFLVALQHLQTTPAPAAAVDTEALIQAVIDHLVPQIQAQFQAIDQELFRQQHIVNEVQNQAKLLPEMRQTLHRFQATSLPEKAGTVQPPRPPFRQPAEDLRQSNR